MNRGSILVVEDNTENLRMLKNILEESGYTVRPAPSGKIALSAAQAIVPDLILLDIKLPDIDGYEICKILKENPETMDVPIIFLTGKTETQDILKGFDLGAADYVIKPYVIPILIARVKTHIKLRMQKKELQELSEIDKLSELPNRRRFDSFLESEWRRCLRERKPISLIMGDIDCFKLYNDKYGHLYGDDVIRRVAGIMKMYGKRASDLPARYGGEEFALIMGNSDADYVLAVAQSICKKVEELHIPHEMSKAGDFITLSLGIAEIVPDKSANPDTLIARADKMLYHAKNDGKNRVMG